MKRVLITGANGFIGSILTEAAIAKGWKVYAGMRRGGKASNLRNAPQAIPTILDFQSVDALKKTFIEIGPLDYIIHCAGATKAIQRDHYFEANAQNTIRLVQACESAGMIPETFVFVSSLAAKGPVERDQMIYIDTPPNPVTDYGASKLEAEQWLHAQSGFPWVGIQPTAVYGPREKDILIMFQTLNKGWSMQLGAIPQQLSFIYARDLVEMILAACEKGKKGRLYIAADGHQYTASDFDAYALKALDRRARKIILPKALVTGLATITEQIAKMRGTYAVLNRQKVAELTAPSWWADPSITFQDLQYQPQYPLELGIRETVEWYQREGWL